LNKQSTGTDTTALHFVADNGVLLSRQVSRPMRSVLKTLPLFAALPLFVTHAPFASVRLKLDVQRKRRGGSGVNFVTAANFFPPFLIQLMMLSLPIFLLGLTDLIFVLLIGGASISIVKFLGFGLCTAN
jgi:hypothetical protein